MYVRHILVISKANAEDEALAALLSGLKKRRFPLEGYIVCRC
jgi:hypothetical protein